MSSSDVLSSQVDTVEGFVHVRAGKFKLWYIVYNPQYLSDWKDNKQYPLLVVHGGPGMPHGYLEDCCLGTVSNQQHFMDAKLAAGMHQRAVIFYDQLGCGMSDKPPCEQHYSLALSVGDLHCLVMEISRLSQSQQILSSHQNLNIMSSSSPTPTKSLQLHLLGHSFGGMLAYEYVTSSYYGHQEQSMRSPPSSSSQAAAAARTTTPIPTETPRTVTGATATIRVVSLLLISTPTSTAISMESSCKCRQRIIGEMVSSNMNCASFVSMDDIDVRANERFVDQHMYRHKQRQREGRRRAPSRGYNNGSLENATKLGHHQVQSAPGYVGNELGKEEEKGDEEGAGRVLLESLVDRAIPSWDGVHTRDLREWAAWHPVRQGRQVERDDQEGMSFQMDVAQAHPPVSTSEPLHICLITGQYDFVNQKCIEHWKHVPFQYFAGPNTPRIFESSIIPEASHMNVWEQPQRVIDCVYSFLAKIENMIPSTVAAVATTEDVK